MDEADTPKPAYDGEKLRLQGSKWMEKIRAAEKREERWRRDAEAAEKAYACDTETKNSGKLYDFNILHSNVETIVPAIYNSTPIPDIRRRFIEAIGEPPEPPPQPQPGQPPQDPRALQQFQIAQQAFAQKEQADKDAKDLGDMIERVIAVQIDDNRMDKEIEANAQDAFLAGRGVVRLRFDAEVGDDNSIKGETIQTEVVAWRDFRMGPGSRWDNKPWIAFRHTLPCEVLEAKHTDKELYAAQGPVPDTGDDDSDDVPFWEIWDKLEKKVYFVREHDCRMLKETDDPLGLKDFYPIPQPIQPITLTGKTTPVCPFTVYKKLADELDTITKRINAIMKGLKVRGLVAGDATDIQQLSNAGDNELVSVANLEGLAQTKGLENAIMWWPIEQAANVLKQLYEQREVVKSAIYEITGISDIIRGASNANETLGAQQIKTQWGALRIQKMQRMIERQVRDLFVMMADIIITKFSPQTLQTISGIQITPGMQALMQQPNLAGYRIDIESDSTVRADLTRQKADMTEFLTGTGTFFGSVGPLVQQAPEMGEPMAEIYASFARVFKLGKQAEDALERMAKMAKAAAKNPPPNPEAEKMKAEQEMKQAEFGMKAEASKADMAIKQQTAQLDSQERMEELQLKREIAGIDREMKLMDLEMKREELAMRREELDMALQAKGAETAMKLSAQKQSNDLKAEQAAQNGKAKQ
ncbi:MAG: hypothetical protein E5Y10_24480 [Mesorhizobium sp.]|nr:MAG: hypothetical protein E5Y10_24480 [Mesorhizobium sp.]